MFLLEEHSRREKGHLVNLICKRINTTPNFALLIGAGASVSSGAKTSGQMITEWRHQLYEQTKSKEPFGKWLRTQDWFEDEEEYSILFERCYDQRSQRRIYIEGCVKGAKPFWGYVYLANIIAHSYFDVTFTPNFDDLLNEACFLYADCRPIVCAHDSAVADIRVTSTRPKIIKLHGDFLYDSIKNTIGETEILEKNMRDKFMQFGKEYGLVIVGYGGNDRSIMDILYTMLNSEGYFPNGLYWCLRKNSRVSKKLDRLMRLEKAYWIEIEDFDEFMAELHNGLGLVLPSSVSDPYKATTERLNRFILAKETSKHQIIKKDIKELEKQVKKFEKAISGKVPTEESDRFVPYLFLGISSLRNGNYHLAVAYFNKRLLQVPSDEVALMGLYDTYELLDDFKKAADVTEKAIKVGLDRSRWYNLKGRTHAYRKSKQAITIYKKALRYSKGKQRGVMYVSLSNAYLIFGKWKEALSCAEKALTLAPSDYLGTINKSIALKKLGRETEAIELVKESLPKIKSKFHRACVFGFLGDKKMMLKLLKGAIRENPSYRVYAKYDPDFADYQEDSDFRKLVYEKREWKKK